MSQYPPPPPAGSPGSTPPPQPGGYGMAPAPQRGNGAAVASLIFGILGCIPWITGLLAVILGFVGLRKTRDPQVGGKGMAVAGIILGILSFVGWTLAVGIMGGGILAFIHGTAPQRELARQFLTDLSKQDVAAASSKTTSAVSKEEVQSLADQVKPWGSLNDTTIFAATVTKSPGHDESGVGGQAVFAKGAHGFTMEMVKEGDAWKIRKVEIK